MKKIIALLVVASTFFVSCDDIDTANVSSITNYPLIEVIGSDLVFVAAGSTYADPGAIATENDAPIEFTSIGSGNYRGGTTIDTNVPDEYSQTYTATNKDGFEASAVRTVIVYKTGDLVTSLEGVYTADVKRNGTITPQYMNLKYIYIWKNANGTYEMSDGIGGYYNLGRGYGIGYVARPVIITATSIPTNTFSVPGFEVGTFGGPATMTNLTVNAATKTITFTTAWNIYTFDVTLTQVQL